MQKYKYYKEKRKLATHGSNKYWDSDSQTLRTFSNKYQCYSPVIHCFYIYVCGCYNLWGVE
jgi:hypothetical protein